MPVELEVVGRQKQGIKRSEHSRQNSDDAGQNQIEASMRNDGMDPEGVNLEDESTEDEAGSDDDLVPFEMGIDDPLESTTATQWWKIYVLQFLFMWNSRTYQHISTFWVADAFSQNLVATSIRGVARTVTSMFFSSALGNWIDISLSRISPLKTSILVSNSIILSSYIWWLIWRHEYSPLTQICMFGIFVILDSIQELGAIANKLSMERDCVPILVALQAPDAKQTLTAVNAMMTRLDIICKLAAPIVLPTIMGVISWRPGWILLLGSANAGLWILQVVCVRRIEEENQVLKMLKKRDTMTLSEGRWRRQSQDHLSVDTSLLQLRTRYQSSCNTSIQALLPQRIRYYFSTSIWPASFAISILQMTVLAYSATLITYLLQMGFTFESVTYAKASGAVAALLGTILTPFVVAVYRKMLQNDHNMQGKTVRKVLVTIILWTMISPSSQPLQPSSSFPLPSSSTNTTTTNNLPFKQTTSSFPLLPTTVFFAFLSLSRLGHWSFDLMIQEIEQTEIPSSERSTFAGIEQSFRSFFELCHWGATLIVSHRGQFKWLALGSLIAIAAAMGGFGVWIKTGWGLRKYGGRGSERGRGINEGE